MTPAPPPATPVVGAPTEVSAAAGTVDSMTVLNDAGSNDTGVNDTATKDTGTTPAGSYRPVIALAVVVAILAAVAGYLVYGWMQSLEQARVAESRDAALSGARQAAINLNSVDPDNLDETFANIESSITGDELTTGLAQSRTQFEEMFTDSGVRVTAVAHRAGLAAFDDDANTAEALVVLDIDTARPEFTEPARARLTVRLDMQEVDGSWRAAQIAQLGDPIALNSPQPVEGAALPDGQAPNGQAPNGQAPNDEARTGTP